MKIIWAQNAFNDLQNIRQHLKAKLSSALVRKVTQDILDEVKSLTEWNGKGVFIRELEALIRRRLLDT